MACPMPRPLAQMDGLWRRRRRLMSHLSPALRTQIPTPMRADAVRPTPTTWAMHVVVLCCWARVPNSQPAMTLRRPRTCHGRFPWFVITCAGRVLELQSGCGKSCWRLGASACLARAQPDFWLPGIYFAPSDLAAPRPGPHAGHHNRIMAPGFPPFLRKYRTASAAAPCACLCVCALRRLCSLVFGPRRVPGPGAWRATD